MEGQGDFTSMKDFIAEDALESIKVYESQIKLLKHNNELETSKISGMVIYFQNLLFMLSNRSLGPFISALRQIFPHLMHNEDMIAAAVIKKYQKMALRVTDEPQAPEKPNVSPGKK